MKVDPSRLVLYGNRVCDISRFGHSLGSAVSVFVTVALVERRNIRIAGLILQVILIIHFHSRVVSCPFIMYWSSFELPTNTICMLQEISLIYTYIIRFRLRKSNVPFVYFMGKVTQLFLYVMQNDCIA